MMPIIAVTPICPALAEPQEVVAPSDKPSDIVVTGRRVAKGGKVVDRYSSGSIRTLNAMTIGEVIARLERRNGGRSFSIIVNGRKLAGISDLREVPPEALAEIQILSESSASIYGLTPTNKVLNLVLKPRFKSKSLNVGLRLPTEGAGKNASSTLQYVAIKDEKRFNTAFSLQRSTSITGKDRDRYLDPFDTDALAQYRTLVASGRQASLTSGLAVPIGSVGLNVSSSISDTLSHQVSRFFLAGGTAASTGMGGDQHLGAGVRSVIDSSSSRLYQLGVGAAGNMGSVNWTAEITGSVVTSRTKSRPSSRVLDVPPLTSNLRTLPTAYEPIAAFARTTNLGVALTANGPLLSLPAGSATVNTTLGATIDRLSSSTSTAYAKQITTQPRSRARIGLDVPIVDPSMSVLGRLGTVSISLAGNYEWAKDVGTIPSYDATLDWQLTRFLTLSFNRDTTKTAPALIRRGEPVISSPGSLVVDASTGAYAIVNRISGGTPDLRVVSQKNDRVRLSLNRPSPNINYILNIEYINEIIVNPIVITGYFSSQFQLLFPGRFGRDSAGRLTSIDTRPFNAESEQKDIVRLNLHVSGQAGSTDGASPEVENDRSLSWDLSITDEWTLRNMLRPSANGGAIDLLKTPIDGVRGTPRHRLNIEASASRHNVNLQLSGRWRSGTRVEDISSLVRSSIRYSSFATVDAEVAWTLPDKRRTTDTAKPVRLWFSVENLLNKRPTVRDDNGRTPTAFQPAFLDPIGRVMIIRASRAF